MKKVSGMEMTIKQRLLKLESQIEHSLKPSVIFLRKGETAPEVDYPVMIVPVIDDMDEWQREAIKQQRELMACEYE